MVVTKFNTYITLIERPQYKSRYTVLRYIKGTAKRGRPENPEGPFDRTGFVTKW